MSSSPLHTPLRPQAGPGSAPTPAPAAGSKAGGSAAAGEALASPPSLPPPNEASQGAIGALLWQATLKHPPALQPLLDSCSTVSAASSDHLASPPEHSGSGGLWLQPSEPAPGFHCSPPSGAPPFLSTLSGLHPERPAQEGRAAGQRPDAAASAATQELLQQLGLEQRMDQRPQAAQGDGAQRQLEERVQAALPAGCRLLSLLRTEGPACGVVFSTPESLPVAAVWEAGRLGALHFLPSLEAAQAHCQVRALACKRACLCWPLHACLHGQPLKTGGWRGMRARIRPRPAACVLLRALGSLD